MAEPQVPNPPSDDGRRPDAGPWLKTIDCATELGVSQNFIIAEIHDGRLYAHVGGRQGRRMYRISRAAWQVYLKRYWPVAARARRTR